MATFPSLSQLSNQRLIPRGNRSLAANEIYGSVSTTNVPKASGFGRTRLEESSTIATDVSSRFGRRLKELRLLRSMTQVDMAKRFGIDRSFISDVERGRKSISLPMLEVIAIGMNISLSQLFEEL